MNEDDVQEINSGVKREGNWREIAEFGEEVSKVLDDSVADRSLRRFEEWRPRIEESERDVKEKTVNKAKLSEKSMEKASDGVKNDLKDASEHAVEAGKKAAKKKNPEPDLKDVSKNLAMPIYSELARMFRLFEGFIYSKLLLRLNPYYLDTEDFSADIKHLSKGIFEMDVSAPKQETRRDLKEGFRDS